jgi:CysZ protein
MIELVRGAGDAARGGRFLLGAPGLWIWVVAPALVTLVLLVAIIAGAVWLIDPVVGWLAAHLPETVAGWVGGLLRFLVIVALVIFGFVMFVSLAGVLAGPFCEILSEKVEEQVTGRPAPDAGNFVVGLVTGLAHSVRRLVVSLFGLVLVMALSSFIPIVGGIIAAAVAFYLAGTSAAYDCFDAVHSRRSWSYRRKVEYLRAHRGRTLGLGCATTALLLVPVVNLMALGVGATGATLAVLDIERRAGAPG